MISIAFGDEETFELDTHNLPRDTAFSALTELLDDYNVSPKQQRMIAMEYYRQGLENEFVQLLESLIKNSVFNEEDQNTTAALLNSYWIKKGRRPQIGGGPDVNNLLKGIISLKEGEAKKAAYFFQMCKFSLGLEVLDFMENRRFVFGNRSLKLLHEYRRGKSSDARTNDETNKYVRYRIDSEYRKQVDITEQDVVHWLGASSALGTDGAAPAEVAEEKRSFFGSIDVLLELAERYIGVDEKTALQVLDRIPDNDDKFFLMGKVEHLKKNYEGAVEHYKRSQLTLARYARCRIEQDRALDIDTRTQESDNFQAYLCRKLNTSIKHECDVHDVFLAKDSPSVYTYRKLAGNPYVSASAVMNNLAFYMWLEMERFQTVSREFKPLHEPARVHPRDSLMPEMHGTASANAAIRSIRSLKEKKMDFLNFEASMTDQKERMMSILCMALKAAPSEYEDAIKHNIDVLGNSDLRDALEQNNVEKIKETRDQNLLGYLHLFNKSLDMARRLLKDDNLALGCIYLEYFHKEKSMRLLDKAVGFFGKSSSVYAVNGMALALVLKGMHSEAKTVLKKLVQELPLANINLGNLYAVEAQYSKAIACFRKVPLSEYTFSVLKALSIIEGDRKLMGDLWCLRQDEELEATLRRMDASGKGAQLDRTEAETEKSGDGADIQPTGRHPGVQTSTDRGAQ
ncbi:UNVERIFIED_CONTAM: hypothetical protein PYX00_011309 [Menopon gallinae]|uniref:Tetratricopeptide repeat protein n=1 Tax=Menopon gallinae TaxID=328185 RepID=A0AAW2H7F0_9NEOP